MPGRKKRSSKTHQSPPLKKARTVAELVEIARTKKFDRNNPQHQALAAAKAATAAKEAKKKMEDKLLADFKPEDGESKSANLGSFKQQAVEKNDTNKQDSNLDDGDKDKKDDDDNKEEVDEKMEEEEEVKELSKGNGH